MLLGLGFAFKVYPAIFVLPLMLYVAHRRLARPGAAAGPRHSHGGSTAWVRCRSALASIVTVVLVNLPFVVAGYDGWRASFAFQQLRKVDITTNSIWYWGLRPDSIGRRRRCRH